MSHDFPQFLLDQRHRSLRRLRLPSVQMRYQKLGIGRLTSPLADGGYQSRRMPTALHKDSHSRVCHKARANTPPLKAQWRFFAKARFHGVALHTKAGDSQGNGLEGVNILRECAGLAGVEIGGFDHLT